MKTREEKRINKQTQNIEQFYWFIELIQTRVAFGWLSERLGEKTYSREQSRNQPILRFDVILQHDWPIEQWLIHFRVFFGGKTKRPCFHLFIDWLRKQIKNSYRNYISRSYENRSIKHWLGKVWCFWISGCLWSMVRRLREVIAFEGRLCSLSLFKCHVFGY